MTSVEWVRQLCCGHTVKSIKRLHTLGLLIQLEVDFAEAAFNRYWLIESTAWRWLRAGVLVGGSGDDGKKDEEFFSSVIGCTISTLDMSSWCDLKITTSTGDCVEFFVDWIDPDRLVFQVDDEHQVTAVTLRGLDTRKA